MSGIVVLQARTTSRRLPAKVLLPIAGVPMVVLAARRAANTGRIVLVATSDDSSDDALAALLRREQIRCARGKLKDVLARFVHALNGMQDESIVFRLTADNVFPEGSLIDDIEREFVDRRLEYLTTSDPESGIPFGVSVEVTRLRHLRTACAEATSAHDREHVTPFIVRRFGKSVFSRYRELRRSLHRCSVDYVDDYLRVSRVFEEVEDAVTVPWLELVRRLSAEPGAPLVERPVGKLVVGGAQLGMRYGIANTSSPPTLDECRTLIDMAIANGSRWIDTAPTYGNSEEKIGSVLTSGFEGRMTVVTKLSPLDSVPPDVTAAAIDPLVESSVYRSCVRLRTPSMDTLLLHRATHLDMWAGAVLRCLGRLRDDGTLRALGVSVQSPAELLRALQEPALTHIQMPFNLLDQRWNEVLPALRTARLSRGLVVHVRSALLQGLLSSNDLALWRRANVQNPAPTIAWLADTSKRFGRQGAVDLCLAYVCSQPWVDGVVIGMDSASQLIDNIRYFDSPLLSVDELKHIESSAPCHGEPTLNPSRWERQQSS